MKKIIRIAILSLVLVGCAKKDDTAIIYNKKTPNFVIKSQSVSYENRMESTPVVLNNKVYDIISNRENHKMIDIYDDTKKLISSTKLGIGLASALVHNDELYVVGSTDWSITAPLKIYKTNDLINYSEVGSLMPNAGNRIFNSSLIHDSNGFVLVTEQDDNETNNFYPVFYRSNDLVTWTRVSDLKFSKYIACPTVRFLNGEYYVFYLLKEKRSNLYYTSISKSLDLINWIQSNKVVIAPENETEGQNASDLDLYELNNQVVMNYVIGNQDSNRPLWSDIKKAYYNGSMENFVKEFF